jgi:hypothetical protein
MEFTELEKEYIKKYEEKFHILSMEEIKKFLNELSEQEENQEDILELENEFNSMEIDNIISEKAE